LLLYQKTISDALTSSSFPYYYCSYDWCCTQISI